MSLVINTINVRRTAICTYTSSTVSRHFGAETKITTSLAGNFRGVQFSWIGDLLTFRCLIFVNASNHTITCMYIQAYFVGLIFAVEQLTAKTAKIGPLENFLLYGIQCPSLSVHDKAKLYICKLITCYFCHGYYMEGIADYILTVVMNTNLLDSYQKMGQSLRT